MKATEWTSFFLRRFALQMAAVVVLTTAGYFILPTVVKAKAVERAKKAGYDMTVERIELRMWEVRLHGMRARGSRADVQADIVTMRYDAEGGVRAERAEVTLKEGERRATGSGKRIEVTLLDSTVRASRAGSNLTAKVRMARMGTDGHVWTDADVKVESDRYSANVRGLKATDMDPEGVIELTADSISVSVAEKKPGPAGGTPEGERKKRKIRVRTNTLSVTGAMSGTAENVLASVETFPWGIEAHAEADSMSAAGNSANMISVDVTKRDIADEDLWIQAEAESVETGDRRLSKNEFSIRKLKFRGTLQKTVLGVSLTGADVRVGEAQASIHAHLGREDKPGSDAWAVASLRMEMPETGCQKFLESLPRELVPVLRPENENTRMNGTISWKLEVIVDLPARKKPDVSIWLRNKCVIKEVPEELNILRLAKPFKYDEYSADGRRHVETVGPGTMNWVSLGAISPFMPMSVMAMEDPSFMAHRGILIEAIENSMEQNITTGKFFRGGSTISMQLAKNLWLAREKTISRKVQEAFLTTYLEQRMTKQKIIELYLNVVEFGPDLYGIGRAARHYFAKEPMSLTLSQSLFLASLLPSPRAAGFEEGKKVSQGRLGLLRRVMKMMLDRGTINQAQYEQGLGETPVFGEPSANGEADSRVRAQDGIDPSEWR